MAAPWKLTFGLFPHDVIFCIVTWFILEMGSFILFYYRYQLLKYCDINIITQLCFLAICRTLNFKNHTINKDFTRTSENKHKTNIYMFLHFHFVPLAIKLWKCKPLRMSDKSAIKSLFMVRFKKNKNSTECLKCAWSYRSWIYSPSSDKKLWYIDITINNSFFFFSAADSSFCLLQSVLLIAINNASSRFLK